uniref:117M18_11 n=1 Tax=Brassica campestris TaxID=3711 RepID=Q4AC09_BRACM|nr:117M18_11 [Brassica rapa]
METSRKRSSSGLLSRSSDSVAGAEEEAAEEEAGTCHRLRSPWVVKFERGSLGGNVAGDSDEKIEPDHLLVLVHGILARDMLLPFFIQQQCHKPVMVLLSLTLGTHIFREVALLGSSR